MSKKSYGRRGQYLKKNPFINKKCFECGEEGHIIVNCPNKKNDKSKKGKKDDDKKKKRFIKRKKNGQAYFVEWDSDASSDDDDDDKSSKGVAEIAIKEAPSLFFTPYCLTANGGAKVLQDDDLEEFSYDDLIDMLTDAGDLVIKEKEKLKDLELKYGSLQASYEELKTSH